MLDCCLRPMQPAPAEGGLIMAGTVFSPAQMRHFTPSGCTFLQPVCPLDENVQQLAQDGFFSGAAGLELIGVDLLSPLIPQTVKLAELCEREGAILALTALPPVLYPNAPSLQEYLTLAEKFPNLRILLSDFGGGLAYYEHMRSVRAVSHNLYYGCWTHTALPLEKAFSVLPLDRIVYGSGGLPQPVLSDDMCMRLTYNNRLLLGGDPI